MIKKLVWMPAALLLAACGGGGGGETGTLSLGVADAPIRDAKSVLVTFSGLELRQGGGPAIPIMFDEPIQLDILALQGEQSAPLIQDVELPAGVYDQIRLFVDASGNANCNTTADTADDNVIVFEGATDSDLDDEVFPLVVPSGVQSGYKVRGPITIAAGGRAAYTVDFDLTRAIAERSSPAGTCYNLKPTSLRVTDNAVVGTLIGNVDAALAASCDAGAMVYVYEGDLAADGLAPDDIDSVPDGTVGDVGPDPLTTAILAPGATAEDPLRYEVGFLLTGPYTVALACLTGEGREDLPELEVGELGAESDDVTPTPDPAFTFLQPQTLTVVETEPGIADNVNPNRVDFVVIPPPAP